MKSMLVFLRKRRCKRLFLVIYIFLTICIVCDVAWYEQNGLTVRAQFRHLSKRKPAPAHLTASSLSSRFQHTFGIYESHNQEWKKDAEEYFLKDFLEQAVNHPRFPPSGADRAPRRAAWLRQRLTVRFDPLTGIMTVSYRAKPSEVAEAQSILLFLGDRITSVSEQDWGYLRMYGNSQKVFKCCIEWHPRAIFIRKPRFDWSRHRES
jgi:hypothetical protein